MVSASGRYVLSSQLEDEIDTMVETKLLGRGILLLWFEQILTELLLSQKKGNCSYYPQPDELTNRAKNQTYHLLYRLKERENQLTHRL